MKKLPAVLAALTLYGSVVYAQAPAAAEHMVFTPENIQWVDAPPVLPPGAKVAVLKGDPAQEGIFTMRLWMPAGYKIMPHWHPAYESVTVISGTAWLGTGDAFDKTKMQKLTAGSFTAIPPMHHHFASAETEAVVQLTAMGPWQLYYINPADHPAKMGAKASGK